jgi:hypothetical protein
LFGELAASAPSPIGNDIHSHFFAIVCRAASKLSGVSAGDMTAVISRLVANWLIFAAT